MHIWMIQYLTCVDDDNDNDDIHVDRNWSTHQSGFQGGPFNYFLLNYLLIIPAIEKPQGKAKNINITQQMYNNLQTSGVGSIRTTPG